MRKIALNRPTFRISAFWDLYLPFSVATVPAILFALLGVASRGMDRAGVEAPIWMICFMLMIQVAGMIAMAIVVLFRWDIGRTQLRFYSGGEPRFWRKLVLLASIASLLVCDICTNLAAAFAGASFLLVGSAVTFLAYLAFVRCAFIGLAYPDNPDSDLTNSMRT